MSLTPEQRAAMRAKAYELRMLAADGITQLTINGKTVRYAGPAEMLKVADSLDESAGGAGLVRTGLKSSRMVYRRG